MYVLFYYRADVTNVNRFIAPPHYFTIVTISSLLYRYTSLKLNKTKLNIYHEQQISTFSRIPWCIAYSHFYRIVIEKKTMELIDWSIAVSLYVSIILGTMCLQASTPLYFEMGCEVCYPVAEGLTNVLLTLLANVISFVFLLLQMIPKIGMYVRGMFQATRLYLLSDIWKAW